MSDLISVIIPACNSGSFIGDAIESALMQTYRPIELVVVDDGSTDNTRSVVSIYSNKVRYVYQENRGVSAARNAGMALAKGEYIAFLDADDRWLPTKLEKQHGLFLKKPRLGLVHCAVYYWRPEHSQNNIRKVKMNVFEGNCYAKLCSGNGITTSSVVVRRKCIDLVGAFDETLSVSEDWDLWIRISRQFLLGYVAEPLALYRQHKGSLASNYIKMREGDLFVIEKALRNDPSLRFGIGRSRVLERLAKVRFGLGYQLFEVGEVGKARHHFRRAVLNNALRVRPMAYYFATMIPSEWSARLRLIKRMMGGRTAVQGTRKGNENE
jgi:glycosyltransferase involved in cell wall biosynthesis